MKVFFANTKQYIEHLLPIFKAFTGDKVFIVPKELKPCIPNHKTLYYSSEREVIFFMSDLISKNKNTLYVVASYGNVRMLSKNGYPEIGFILLEHGAGQVYQSDVAGWCRGSFKSSYRIKLFLGTNHYCVDAFKKNIKRTPAYVVGCPKLDNIQQEVNNYNNPLVVFSWHWDCSSIPETRSGFEFWSKEVLAIHKDKEKKFKIAVHGHPRIQDQTLAFCTKHDIPFIKTFDFVLKNANIYVVDNSSTLYEFAVTTKPVILLNNPFYRREVRHGMRFWEHADLGLNCDQIGDIRANIDYIITNRGDNIPSKRKRIIVEEVYPYLGSATNKVLKYLTSTNIIT